MGKERGRPRVSDGHKRKAKAKYTKTRNLKVSAELKRKHLDAIIWFKDFVREYYALERFKLWDKLSEEYNKLKGDVHRRITPRKNKWRKLKISLSEANFYSEEQKHLHTPGRAIGNRVNIDKLVA